MILITAREERSAVFKTKRAGLGTKFVILAVLAGTVTAFLSLNARLSAAEAKRDALIQQVQTQQEDNAALANDIANRDDPERLAEIAREKLGLIKQDEIVFVDTSK